MKPIKNRHFCKDCGRIKMLFETEKKAETFMKFNGNEIELETGYKPERSYFCDYCGGWHTTSRKEELVIKSRTDIVLEIYTQEKEKKAQKQAEAAQIRAEKKEKVIESLNVIENFIKTLKITKSNTDAYSDVLEKALNEFEKIVDIKPNFKGCSKRIKDFREKLNMLRLNQN